MSRFCTLSGRRFQQGEDALDRVARPHVFGTPVKRDKGGVEEILQGFAAFHDDAHPLD
jgi:hypothetical protein